MQAARKKDSGDIVFKIHQISTSDNGKLKCKLCPAEVQYVSEHTRGASNTPVAAYLRLSQREKHRKDCEYSVNVAIDKLVAESKAVEDISQIFDLYKVGSYLFRMNILIEALEVAQEASKMDNALNGSKRVITGRRYVHTGQHLDSYFRSATGLVRLRALIEDASDIKLLTQIVKIQYKDSSIPWKNFYYDQPRYPELFNSLSKRKIFHPVALNLTISKKAKYSKDAKYLPWSFQCYSEIIFDNGNNLVFIPRLRLAKEEFSTKLSQGDTVLVVGKAWTHEVTNANSIFRNFSVSVYNESQFMKELD